MLQRSFWWWLLSFVPSVAIPPCSSLLSLSDEGQVTLPDCFLCASLLLIGFQSLLPAHCYLISPAPRRTFQADGVCCLLGSQQLFPAQPFMVSSMCQLTSGICSYTIGSLGCSFLGRVPLLFRWPFKQLRCLCLRQAFLVHPSRPAA